MLGADVSAAGAGKNLATRSADLIRLLGSDSEGEVLAAHGALKRLLASRGFTFTDLGNDLEKLATGGLEEAEMKRLYDAGYQKGVADTERKHIEAQGAFGLRLDGSKDWEAIALHCQREKERIEAKHHRFVDDMCSRMTWGSAPSERQGKYLLSLFRGVGGRIK
jgi:hypothetical protein